MKWDDLSVTPTTTLIPNAVFTHKEKLHIQKHIFINPYPCCMFCYRDKVYTFISRELLYLAQLQKNQIGPCVTPTFFTLQQIYIAFKLNDSFPETS